MKARHLSLVLLVAVGCAAACAGAEEHADGIIARILENAAKIKAADPKAVPMAFWDFDGTIIKGDITGGWDDDWNILYKGLVHRTIEAGFNSVYSGQDGLKQFFEADYPRLRRGIGKWLAWPFLAQMYFGQSEAKLDAFCRAECEKVYRKWFFASSVKMLQALEQAGVENYIISASPELFVRSASDALGLPPERFRGIRVHVACGRITTQILYPVPDGEGKVENLRDIVLARPHGVAVAAFGNSYSTDGAFLRYVATQPSLPGGARGTAVMINGRHPVEGYAEHFVKVSQDETIGGMRTQSTACPSSAAGHHDP
jgi:phosphoserine phosphatase